MIRHTALLKGLTEELRHVMFNTHGTKHHSKLPLGPLAQRRLLYDLRRQLVMRQSISRKNGKLLAPDQRRQPVNGRDPCTDIVPGILSLHRVQRQTVYISPVRGHNRSQPVNRFTDPVKGTSQHIRRYRHLHRTSCQLGMGILKRHILRPFKHLDHRLVLIQLNDPSHLLLLSFYCKFHDLIIECVLQAFQHHQRTIYAAQPQIFYRHPLRDLLSYPFFSITRL